MHNCQSVQIYQIPAQAIQTNLPSFHINKSNIDWVGHQQIYTFTVHEETNHCQEDWLCGFNLCVFNWNYSPLMHGGGADSILCWVRGRAGNEPSRSLKFHNRFLLLPRYFKNLCQPACPYFMTFASANQFNVFLPWVNTQFSIES